MPRPFKGAARANQKLGHNYSAPPPLGRNSPRCCPHWLPQAPHGPEPSQLSPVPSLSLGDFFPPVLLSHFPSLSPMIATSQLKHLYPTLILGSVFGGTQSKMTCQHLPGFPEGAMLGLLCVPVPNSRKGEWKE